MTNDKPVKELTGRMVLMILLSAFGIILAVNIFPAGNRPGICNLS